MDSTQRNLLARRWAGTSFATLDEKYADDAFDIEERYEAARNRLIELSMTEIVDRASEGNVDAVRFLEDKNFITIPKAE